MRKQATLKEMCYEYSEDDLDLEPTEWNAADCLVKIFDVYAIGFAYWCEWCDYRAFKTYEELLEIYKEENNL